MVSGGESEPNLTSYLSHSNSLIFSRQLQKQFSKYRPPALPYAQTGATGQSYTYGQGNNPYANNPPPPTSFGGDNQYGSNPPPPPATYQPSMAGQYGNKEARNTGTSGMNGDQHQHGYEWEQAREAERLEREQNGGNAPPGYDVSTAATSKSSVSRRYTVLSSFLLILQHPS